jgi:hypothetical protein
MSWREDSPREFATLRMLYIPGDTENAVVHGMPQDGMELAQKPFATSDLLRKARSIIDKTRRQSIDAEEGAWPRIFGRSNRISGTSKSKPGPLRSLNSSRVNVFENKTQHSCDQYRERFKVGRPYTIIVVQRQLIPSK